MPIYFTFMQIMQFLNKTASNDPMQITDDQFDIRSSRKHLEFIDPVSAVFADRRMICMKELRAGRIQNPSRTASAIKILHGIRLRAESCSNGMLRA